MSTLDVDGESCAAEAAALHTADIVDVLLF